MGGNSYEVCNSRDTYISAMGVCSMPVPTASRRSKGVYPIVTIPCWTVGRDSNLNGVKFNQLGQLVPCTSSIASCFTPYTRMLVKRHSHSDSRSSRSSRFARSSHSSSHYHHHHHLSCTKPIRLDSLAFHMGFCLCVCLSHAGWSSAPHVPTSPAVIQGRGEDGAHQPLWLTSKKVASKAIAEAMAECMSKGQRLDPTLGREELHLAIEAYSARA